MDPIYIVVWHGGHEPASYTAIRKPDTARRQYLEWTEEAEQTGEEGDMDTVDFLRLTEVENGHLRTERLSHEEVMAL